MNKFLFTAFWFTLISFPAYAYLDPGTFTIIGTVIASVVAAIAGFFNNIKIQFKKILSNLRNKNK